MTTKAKHSVKFPKDCDPGLLLASARGIGTDTERLLPKMRAEDRANLLRKLWATSCALLDIETARDP